MSGITSAWAVHVEADGTSWIRGDYDVYGEPTGDANLKIEKRADRIAVHKVTVGDYKYDRREKPMDEWEPIPVEWVGGQHNNSLERTRDSPLEARDNQDAGS